MPRPSAFPFALALATLPLAVPGAARAQRDLPPGNGGLTCELGMPPVCEGRSGFGTGWYRPPATSTLQGYPA